MVRLGWLELRSHVAGAVHRAKCQPAHVRLVVAGDLPVHHVLLPLAGLLPAERGDPGHRARRRHRAVRVARVVEHADLAGELLVDPLAGLGLGHVGDVLSAKVPRLHVVGDVHGLAHRITVHVVQKAGAKRARWQLLKLLLVLGARPMDGPWSVVSGCHGLVFVRLRSALSTLVEVWEGSTRLYLLLAILVHSQLRVGSSAPAHSKDVVDVDFLDDGFKLAEQVHAYVADTDHVGHVPVAIERLKLFMHLLTHERVPIGRLKLGRRAVKLPVGDAVAHRETLQVWFEIILISLLVMLDDVVGQIGHIHSGIRLT